jgi:acetate kinase
VAEVLVVNAGSTSLKLDLVSEGGRAEVAESLEAVDPLRVEAVAHRVVHGGQRFREPVLIDARVREEIFELEAIAPLHNAPALAGIKTAERRFSAVPHVAVFDTGFHATIPPEAATFAVPRRWREEWGIRRYGFHGLSVEWSARRVPELLGRPSEGLRLVVGHLGGGSSVTAVRDGRSVDTTMGFSPLEGVPMTTRAGSVDPGALVYLLRERALDVDALDHALNVESGLKGLAGGSGDMRELEGAVLSADSSAVLALDVFVHRVSGAVAAMAAAAGGLDAVAFTAGIGEGSALVRERVCERLHFLGVELDPELNTHAVPDCDIAVRSSPTRVLVVRAREELVAAQSTWALLRATTAAPRSSDERVSPDGERSD